MGLAYLVLDRGSTLVAIRSPPAFCAILLAKVSSSGETPGLRPGERLYRPLLEIALVSPAGALRCPGGRVGWPSTLPALGGSSAGRSREKSPGLNSMVLLHRRVRWEMTKPCADLALS